MFGFSPLERSLTAGAGEVEGLQIAAQLGLTAAERLEQRLGFGFGPLRRPVTHLFRIA